jgi:uncharacterized protein (DUF342 family)
MTDRKEAKEAGIVWNDFIFKVSQDDLYVFLEDPLIEASVKQKFNDHWKEIKNFLQKEGISALLEEPEIIDGKIIVAKGHLPKEGISEKIELLPKFTHISAEESSEKSYQEKINLRETFQKIVCAESQEPIAKWYPAIPPTPGINIWGDPIEPPPLKEERTFELGENVYLDEGDHYIKAKTSGVVIFEKNKLDVLPEYILKGDVDFSTGNIKFVGRKLIIQGDIKFGFSVNCKGDLELKGCTENKVYIFVEGLFICEGVLRGEETKVKVKGSAKIRGAEFANLAVDGDLWIKDYLVFTNTSVIGNIIVTDGKGLIYGGKVTASGDITAKILGHPAQTKTEVFAGYTRDTVESYLYLLEKEEIYIESLKKIKYGIELSEKLKRDGRFSPKQEGILQKLLAEKEKIEIKLKETKEKINKIKDNLKDLRLKTIKVMQKIYPNVILGIADHTYTNESELSGPITFYLEESNIKTKEGV